jgi:type I restriction enzyme, S subunit
MSESTPLFEIARLGEHAEILAGPPFNSALFTDKPEDIPLVKGENVQQGYVDWNIAKHWPANDAETYKRYRLVPGDVVVAMDRPWVTAGIKWAYIRRDDPPALLVQRVARLRSKKTLDQSFLRCLISSSYFSNYIQPIVTGVNVPHISGKQIADFKIPVPSLETQKKIAAILSAYDDLIANNQRRITLLEHMAEDIYREWFVRLRFPGHEQAKMEKGLPLGWSVKKIGQIFKTSSGGTPSRAEPENFGGSIPWIKTGELKSTFALGSEETITQRAIENSAAKIYKKNTVVMAMYCAMPDISIISNDAATNQACCAFIPHNSAFHHSYCFFLIKFAQLQLVMFAHGAAQQNLSQDIIKKFHVLLPSESLILDFGKKAEPLFESIESLMRANLQLKVTRDALLPRLISGKLAVDALEIRFPPSFENFIAPD